MKAAILMCVVATAIAAPGISVGRIVGGKEALPGQFPYHVVLKWGELPICGGIILGRRTILTSAFCTIMQGNDEMEVLVGTNRLSTGGKLYTVSEMYVHPESDPEAGTYNIGIIKLQELIEFNTEAQAIKLADAEVSAGDILTMTGFGAEAFPGYWSDILRYVEVDVVSAEVCQNIWDDWMEGSLKLDDSHICTRAEGKGACLMDYGGPMANSNGELVGVSSVSAPCAVGLPDLSTSTFRFRDWIVRQIE